MIPFDGRQPLRVQTNDTCASRSVRFLVVVLSLCAATCAAIPPLTPTSSASASPTLSVSPTASESGSPTLTESPSNAHSMSVKSSSLSQTFTEARSVSQSPNSTHTLPTPTLSRASPSEDVTKTATLVLTLTTTPSISRSISGSRSMASRTFFFETPSSTQSKTNSVSLSVSKSVSGQQSGSPSTTFTDEDSISDSVTLTPEVPRASFTPTTSDTLSASAPETGTLSPTPSASDSFTPSADPTNSDRSGSASAQESMSPSISDSPTLTGDRSITQSRSVTPTPSRTASVTESSSSEASFSRTLTESSTRDVSATATTTPSEMTKTVAKFSPTSSGSPQPSLSKSNTLSDSNSISGSVSRSPSNSLSLSNEISASPSETASSSPSRASLTDDESGSFSATGSITRSLSKEATMSVRSITWESPTLSPTFSTTPTASRSVTLSFSDSSTESPSWVRSASTSVSSTLTKSGASPSTTISNEDSRSVSVSSSQSASPSYDVSKSKDTASVSLTSTRNRRGASATAQLSETRNTQSISFSPMPSASVSVTESIRTISAFLSNTSSMTEQASNSLTESRSGASPTLQESQSRSLTSSDSPSGSQDTSVSHTVSVNGTSDTTSVSFQITSTESGSESSTQSAQESLSKSISLSASLSPDLSSTPSLVLSPSKSISATGSVTNSDSSQKSGSRSSSDSQQATASVTPTLSTTVPLLVTPSLTLSTYSNSISPEVGSASRSGSPTSTKSVSPASSLSLSETPSSSSSASLTVSSQPTLSISASRSRSPDPPSQSDTVSHSTSRATHSAARSQTVSISPTPTPSASPDPPSASATPSSTRSPSATNTDSISTSQEVSLTPTRSAAATVSRTPTPTHSATSEHSLTLSPSSQGTDTPSLLLSLSSSLPITLSESPSYSSTPSPSSTHTASNLASDSVTMSHTDDVSTSDSSSVSLSDSASPSVSAEVSVSTSLPPSSTPSIISTPSPTGTFTETQQASQSETASSSLTPDAATRTDTPSPSGTNTLSLTADLSASLTRTPRITPSSSMSVSESSDPASMSKSPSPTDSEEVTLTPTPTTSPTISMSSTKNSYSAQSSQSLTRELIDTRTTSLTGTSTSTQQLSSVTDSSTLVQTDTPQPTADASSSWSLTETEDVTLRRTLTWTRVTPSASPFPTDSAHRVSPTKSLPRTLSRTVAETFSETVAQSATQELTQTYLRDSRTHLRSRSPTITEEMTLTRSVTPSVSPQGSVSPSETPSSSASIQGTVTDRLLPTQTHQPTPSTTITMQSTMTESTSDFKTLTITDTDSGTLVETLTYAPLPTHTGSLHLTTTISETPISSSTETRTFELTLSAVEVSVSPSQSATISERPTVTRSETGSGSPTGDRSLTRSTTLTNVRTSSLSPTLTPTLPETLSPTGNSTPSASPTDDYTPSKTPTVSRTRESPSPTTSVTITTQVSFTDTTSSTTSRTESPTQSVVQLSITETFSESQTSSVTNTQDTFSAVASATITATRSATHDTTVSHETLSLSATSDLASVTNTSTETASLASPTKSSSSLLTVTETTTDSHSNEPTSTSTITPPPTPTPSGSESVTVFASMSRSFSPTINVTRVTGDMTLTPSNANVTVTQHETATETHTDSLSRKASASETPSSSPSMSPSDSPSGESLSKYKSLSHTVADTSTQEIVPTSTNTTEQTLSPTGDGRSLSMTGTPSQTPTLTQSHSLTVTETGTVVSATQQRTGSATVPPFTVTTSPTATATFDYISSNAFFTTVPRSDAYIFSANRQLVLRFSGVPLNPDGDKVMLVYSNDTCDSPTLETVAFVSRSRRSNFHNWTAIPRVSGSMAVCYFSTTSNKWQKIEKPVRSIQLHAAVVQPAEPSLLVLSSTTELALFQATIYGINASFDRPYLVGYGRSCATSSTTSTISGSLFVRPDSLYTASLRFSRVPLAGDFSVCYSGFPHTFATTMTVSGTRRIRVAGSVSSAMPTAESGPLAFKVGRTVSYSITGLGLSVRDAFFLTNASIDARMPPPCARPFHWPGEVRMSWGTIRRVSSSTPFNLQQYTVDFPLQVPYNLSLCYRSNHSNSFAFVKQLDFSVEPILPHSRSPNVSYANRSSPTVWSVGGDVYQTFSGEGLDRTFDSAFLVWNSTSCDTSAAAVLPSDTSVLPMQVLRVAASNITYVYKNVPAIVHGSGNNSNASRVVAAVCYKSNFSQPLNMGVIIIEQHFWNISDPATWVAFRFGVETRSNVTLSISSEGVAPTRNSSQFYLISGAAATCLPVAPLSAVLPLRRGATAVTFTTGVRGVWKLCATSTVTSSVESASIAVLPKMMISFVGSSGGATLEQIISIMQPSSVTLDGGVDFTIASDRDSLVLCNSSVSALFNITPASANTVLITSFAFGRYELCVICGLRPEIVAQVRGVLTVAPSVMRMDISPTAATRFVGVTAVVTIYGFGLTSRDALYECARTSTTPINSSDLSLAFVSLTSDTRSGSVPQFVSVWEANSTVANVYSLCYDFAELDTVAPAAVGSLAFDATVVSVMPSSIFSSTPTNVTIIGNSAEHGIKLVYLRTLSDARCEQLTTLPNGAIQLPDDAVVMNQTVASAVWSVEAGMVRGRFALCYRSYTGHVHTASQVAVNGRVTNFITTQDKTTNTTARYAGYPLTVVASGSALNTDDFFFLVSSSNRCSNASAERTLLSPTASSQTLVSSLTLSTLVASRGVYTLCFSVGDAVEPSALAFPMLTVSSSFHVSSNRLSLIGPAATATPQFRFQFSLQPDDSVLVPYRTLSATSAIDVLLLPYGAHLLSVDLVLSNGVVMLTINETVSSPASVNFTFCTTFPQTMVQSDGVYQYAMSLIALYNFDAMSCYLRIPTNFLFTPSLLISELLTKVSVDVSLLADSRTTMDLVSRIALQVPQSEAKSTALIAAVLSGTAQSLNIPDSAITESLLLSHADLLENIFVASANTVASSSTSATVTASVSQELVITAVQRLNLVAAKFCSSGIVATGGSPKVVNASSFAFTVANAAAGAGSVDLASPNGNMSALFSNANVQTGCIMTATSPSNFIPASSASSTGAQRMFRELSAAGRASAATVKSFNIPLQSLSLPASTAVNPLSLIKTVVMTYAHNRAQWNASLSSADIGVSGTVYVFVPSSDSATSGSWLVEPAAQLSADHTNVHISLDVSKSVASSPTSASPISYFYVSGIYDVYQIQAAPVLERTDDSLLVYAGALVGSHIVFCIIGYLHDKSADKKKALQDLHDPTRQPLPPTAIPAELGDVASPFTEVASPTTTARLVSDDGESPTPQVVVMPVTLESDSQGVTQSEVRTPPRQTAPGATAMHQPAVSTAAPHSMREATLSSLHRLVTIFVRPAGHPATTLSRVTAQATFVFACSIFAFLQLRSVAWDHHPLMNVLYGLSTAVAATPFAAPARMALMYQYRDLPTAVSSIAAMGGVVIALFSSTPAAAAIVSSVSGVVLTVFCWFVFYRRSSIASQPKHSNVALVVGGVAHMIVEVSCVAFLVYTAIVTKTPVAWKEHNDYFITVGAAVVIDWVLLEPLKNIFILKSHARAVVRSAAYETQRLRKLFQKEEQEAAARAHELLLEQKKHEPFDPISAGDSEQVAISVDDGASERTKAAGTAHRRLPPTSQNKTYPSRQIFDDFDDVEPDESATDDEYVGRYKRVVSPIDGGYNEENDIPGFERVFDDFPDSEPDDQNDGTLKYDVVDRPEQKANQQQPFSRLAPPKSRPKQHQESRASIASSRRSPPRVGAPRRAANDDLEEVDLQRLPSFTNSNQQFDAITPEATARVPSAAQSVSKRLKVPVGKPIDAMEGRDQAPFPANTRPSLQFDNPSDSDDGNPRRRTPLRASSRISVLSASVGSNWESVASGEGDNEEEDNAFGRYEMSTQFQPRNDGGEPLSEVDGYVSGDDA